MSENLITCHCQHCNGGIQFDASSFAHGETRNAECPHCHLETVIFIPHSSSPPKATPPGHPPVLNQSVRGTILDYAIQTNAGVISGDDGNRYSFHGAEWRESGKFPCKGQRVDFSPQSGFATAIYLIKDAVSNDGERRECDRMIAALLAIFLGFLGIHKFYMGQSKIGVIYIIVGVVTCGWGFVVTGIIGLIEGISYLSCTENEFRGKYFENQGNAIPPDKNPVANSSGSRNHNMKILIWIISIIAFVVFIGLMSAFVLNRANKDGKQSGWLEPCVTTNGDVVVSINRIWVGPVICSDGVSSSSDDYLHVYVNVSNLSTTKKIEFDSWRKYGPTLEDDNKNSYGLIQFTIPVWDQLRDHVTIYPGQETVDRVVFQKPTIGHKWLHLQLPACNFGGSGELKFNIQSVHA